MSNNTGTYVLGTSEGYRVCYGTNLEKMTLAAITAFSDCPVFKNYPDALSFASMVDSVNKTEFGILVLNYIDFSFAELMTEKRKSKK